MSVGATPSVAQDSHYWAEQYGTRAALLGGALIGSVRDMSSTYYNPGAAALHQEASFVLSGRALRRGTLTLESGAGEGRDLVNTSESPIPTLLATPIEFDWLGDHVIAYSVLTRQRFEVDVSAYGAAELDVFPQPGEEAVVGSYSGDVSLRESWTGLTWAYPLSARLGVGVSQFLAIRSQGRRGTVLAAAATDAGDVAIAVRSRNRDYKHYRTLTKIGLSFDLDWLALGLTATTPSISLKGDGTAAFNGAAAGVDVISGDADQDYLAANVQTDIPAHFKSGWAVGSGLGVNVGGTRFHASAEWFQAVQPFTVVDAEDFATQSGSQTLPSSDITAQFKSVINWGVGIEQPIGGVMLFGGLAVDKSTHPSDAPIGTDLTLTRFDLWRYSGGASFRLGPSEIMLGLGYASGSQPFFEPVNLSDFEVDPSPSEVESLNLRYSQWTLVLGFELVRGGGDEPESGAP